MSVREATNILDGVVPTEDFYCVGKRAVSNAFIASTSQILKVALNFVGIVILARLLAPEDFGLVAMASVLTGYLGLFKEAGLSTATVQNPIITQQQVSNLFWLNIVLGAATSFVAAALGPAIAWFYGDSRLVGVMLALSTSFLLTGSTVQHYALLVREMRFKTIGIIEVGSLAVSIVTASGMALYGFTYWSLVGMQLSFAFCTLLLTWWFSDWRPDFPKRNTGTAPLLKFGVHLTASDLLSRFARGTDSILIGRLYGTQPLGLYTRANALLSRPLEQVLSPIGSVVIPVLARLQSDPERYRRAFLRVYDLVAAITFPLTALLFVLSRPLVLTLLGSQWEQIAPIFAASALAAISMPLAFAASWLFITQGRGRDLLNVSSVLSILIVAAFVSGLPWGPLGVITCYSVYGLIVRLPVLYYLAGRSGPVKSVDLWEGFLHHLPCWLVVYVITSLSLSTMPEAEPLTQLVICGSVGTIAALASILSFGRARASALYALAALRSALAAKSSDSHSGAATFQKSNGLPRRQSHKKVYSRILARMHLAMLVHEGVEEVDPRTEIK